MRRRRGRGVARTALERYHGAGRQCPVHELHLVVQSTAHMQLLAAAVVAVAHTSLCVSCQIHASPTFSRGCEQATTTAPVRRSSTSGTRNFNSTSPPPSHTAGGLRSATALVRITWGIHAGKRWIATHSPICTLADNVTHRDVFVHAEGGQAVVLVPRHRVGGGLIGHLERVEALGLG